jgi:hypothetical protein
MSLPSTPLAAVGKHLKTPQLRRERALVAEPAAFSSTLAQRLDLSMAGRNRLLLAGGFAPAYLEPLYDGDPMRSLRESLRRLLAAHKPIPTSIGDGLWNVVEADRAVSLLWDGVHGAGARRSSRSATHRPSRRPPERHRR